MPVNEKEYNGDLFDRSALLEDIEDVAIECKCQPVLDIISKKRRQIERKLYQQLPLIEK